MEDSSLWTESDTFLKNVGYIYSGSIYFRNTRNQSAYLTSCKFLQNSAPLGSSIFAFSGALYVTKSFFSLNNDTGSAGTLTSIFGSVHITLSNFSSNRCSGGYGGAVSVLKSLGTDGDVFDILNSGAVAEVSLSIVDSLFDFNIGNIPVSFIIL